MLLLEQEIDVPARSDSRGIIEHFRRGAAELLSSAPQIASPYQRFRARLCVCALAPSRKRTTRCRDRLWQLLGLARPGTDRARTRRQAKTGLRVLARLLLTI